MNPIQTQLLEMEGGILNSKLLSCIHKQHSDIRMWKDKVKQKWLWKGAAERLTLDNHPETSFTTMQREFIIINKTLKYCVA